MATETGRRRERNDGTSGGRGTGRRYGRSRGRATEAPGRRRLPVLVTLLSALVPGLGHLALGRRRIALIFLVPTLVVTLLVDRLDGVPRACTGWRRRSSCPARSPSCSPRTSLVAGWRTSAAVDAVRRTHPGRAAVAGSAAVLILLVGIPHLAAANAILAAHDFLDETFAGANPTAGPDTAAVETPVPEFTEPPEETESPLAPSPTPSPLARRRPRRRPRRPSRRTPRTAATGRSPRSGPRSPGSAPTRSSPGATTAGSTCC